MRRQTLGSLVAMLALGRSGADIPCIKDTGGTCEVFGCASTRNSECDTTTHRCMCRGGYCAVGGDCVDSCDTVTSGTCSAFSCQHARGNTSCIGGRCVCAADSCKDVDGICKDTSCTKSTGGTCSVLGCDAWRQSNCVNGQCVCGDDTCATGGRWSQCLRPQGVLPLRGPTDAWLEEVQVARPSDTPVSTVLSRSGSEAALSALVLASLAVGVCRCQSRAPLQNADVVVHLISEEGSFGSAD